MSTPVDILGGTIPDCYPPSANDLWQTMWQTLIATLSLDYPCIVSRNTTPDADEQDCLWYDTVHGVWKQFTGGSWTVIPLDKQFLSFWSAFYAEDTGVANALQITFPDRPLTGSYAAGLVFWVKVLASNSGATTLKVDGLAAKACKKFISTGVTDLAQGDLIAGGIYVFVYDGTQFILLNPTPPALTGTQFFPIAKPFYSGTEVTWQPFDLWGAGVPKNAKSIILQAKAAWQDAIDGDVYMEYRTGAGAQVYIAARVGGIDGTAAAMQGEYPISVTGGCEFRVVGAPAGKTNNVEVTLIGYTL